MNKWVYQRNKTKFFHFTINAISQARREKKRYMKKIMGLPIKQYKSLLLHYQPSFSGEKIKKACMKQKKWVYQKKKKRVFYFTINPVSQARRQKNILEKKKEQVYQRKKIRVFYFTINPIFQARRQKKHAWNKKMGLPTKENKSLLLHYQPSFPGKKTKKTCLKQKIGSTSKMK